jgi:signal recognition particle subunit SEC65
MNDELDFWMDSEDEKNIEKAVDDDSDVPAAPKKEKNPKNPKISESPKKNSAFLVIGDDDESENDTGNELTRMITRSSCRGPQIPPLEKEIARASYMMRKIYTEADVPNPEIKENPETRALKESYDEVKNMIKKLEEEVNSVEVASVKYPAKSVALPDDGSDGEAEVVSDKKKVILTTQDKSIEWLLYWGKDVSFSEVLVAIPEKYRNCEISIDGIQMSPEQIPYDLVNPGDTLILFPSQEEPVSLQTKDDGEFIRLSFLLPDGTKKKLKIPLDFTWGEALEKLGVGRKLMFDGEPLNARQKVGSNDDIEDEDQIDVYV